MDDICQEWREYGMFETDTKIGFEECKMITEALKYNTSLTELSLEGIYFGGKWERSEDVFHFEKRTKSTIQEQWWSVKYWKITVH